MNIFYMFSMYEGRIISDTTFTLYNIFLLAKFIYMLNIVILVFKVIDFTNFLTLQIF